jgi:hypothetical protein
MQKLVLALLLAFTLFAAVGCALVVRGDEEMFSSDMTVEFPDAGSWVEMSHKAHGWWTLSDGRTVEIRNATIRLEGVSYGKLGPGDTVVVTDAGTITVNGKVRTPASSK